MTISYLSLSAAALFFGPLSARWLALVVAGALLVEYLEYRGRRNRVLEFELPGGLLRVTGARSPEEAARVAKLLELAQKRGTL